VGKEYCDLPSISVIVPVCNGRQTIVSCLESLLAQEYPQDRYEIIIVDNNSSDGTVEIVKTYPVQLLVERKQSAHAARNTGIQHAGGELIAFTDADCIAESRWLSELVRPFVEEDTVGVAGRIAPFPSRSLVAEFLSCTMRHINFDTDEPLAVPTGNVAYRRQALLDIGLLDDSIEVADVDLSWRIQVVLLATK